MRPLLTVAKARLIATLKAAGIGFVEDPSNADPRFTRARLRKMMAEFSAEGLTVNRLTVLARRMARANEALEAAAEAGYARVQLRAAQHAAQIDLSRSAFFALPAEIGVRVLGQAIARTGNGQQPALAKLEALWAWLSSAQIAGVPNVRRTLAGTLVTMAGDRISVRLAPLRRERREAAGPEM